MKIAYNFNQTMRRFRKIKNPIAYNERGLASIVVVAVLVVLIALVSIGFSRLTNRDLGQSVEDQKSRAAYYAAESGINDVIKLLKTGSNPCNSNPGNCQAN